MTFHQKNLFVLFIIRIFSSFSFAVMFSSLTLYLTSTLSLNEKFSSEIVGTFIALNYLLPIIGGFIGNKLVNFKVLYCLGMVTQSLGAILLGLHYEKFLNYELAMFLMGGMVSSVSILVFIGKIAGNNDNNRRRALLWNYCAMNIGFFLGYFISGWFGNHHIYHLLFSIMGILPLISVFLVSKYLNIENIFANTISHPILTLISIFICLIIFSGYAIANSYSIRLYLLVVSFLCMSYFLFLSFVKTDPHERQNLILFVFYMFISIAFWSIYLLIPTAIMDFVKDHVNTDIGSIKIAPQWLDNIDPLVVIIGSSCLACFFKKIEKNYRVVLKTPILFFLGIIFSAIGLLSINHFINNSALNTSIPLLSVVLFITALSIGEIFIGPEGYNLPARLAPNNIKGFATGVWVSTLGTASVVASYISDKILSIHDLSPLEKYNETFHFALIASLVIAFLTLVLGCTFDKRKDSPVIGEVTCP